ncbi:hypothetical protein [Sphaerimonospora thailandensis]|uniref:hypothetical protein n=1 Tax=Sphaerimonospora thailandensis TaxID=795644 RepID=UPI00194F5A9A|nr:hypothetical protein [Sphaerimonospora thailandensis]
MVPPHRRPPERDLQRLPFVFTWHPSHQPQPEVIDPIEEFVETRRLWEEWVSRCEHQGRWREAVVRSLITLKALTYSPTDGPALQGTAML